MNFKIIFIMLLLLGIGGASAITNIVLPDISTGTTLTWENNTDMRFTTSSTDAILNVFISLKELNTSNKNMTIVLADGFTYTVKQYNYYYITWPINLLPRVTTTHSLDYAGINVFNKTMDTMLGEEEITIAFDTNLKNTSFKMATGLIFGESETYDTKNYSGMPAQVMRITSDSGYPFNVRMLYADYLATLAFIEGYNSLSNVGKMLYHGLYIITFGSADLSMTIAQILDLIVSAIVFISAMLFTYPWDIFIYIIIIGNFVVAWKSNTIKEMVINFKDYYMFVLNKSYAMIDWVVKNYIPVLIILVIIIVINVLNSNPVTVFLSWLGL